MTLNDELKQQHWDTLINFAPESLSWNHYDLAKNTPLSSIENWRQFLSEPEVRNWLTNERELLQEIEYARLTLNVNERSVGQAQLINSLSKIQENQKRTTDGPIFIYSYVPLNNEQQQAPNVHKLETDIFYVPPKFNFSEDS
jgi:hypothetical protein